METTKTDNTKKGRVLKGVVVSDRMDKTIIVRVSRLKKHRIYKKYFRVDTRYPVHDPERQYHVGDVVRIGEGRPMSKMKRWSVIELIERAKREEE